MLIVLGKHVRLLVPWEHLIPLHRSLSAVFPQLIPPGVLLFSRLKTQVFCT